MLVGGGRHTTARVGRPRWHPRARRDCPGQRPDADPKEGLADSGDLNTDMSELMLAAGREWGNHSWNVAAASPISGAAAATEQALAELDSSAIGAPWRKLGPGPHRSGDVAELLEKKVTTVAPTRNGLIAKGMIYSPSHERHGVYSSSVRWVYEADSGGRGRGDVTRRAVQ